jgi:signal peptidase I
VFVKRVVAGPGDLIAIVGGHVVRNGVREAEPYAASCDPGAACDFPTAVRVPPDEYYVLGDNRGVSDDSRFWGPVPSGWIIGTVVHCSLLDTVCHPVR